MAMGRPKAAFPITREPGYQIFEYACHEGNYSMRNRLSAARNARVPLSVCGEMAANREGALLLVGLGYRELSMAPSSIRQVRHALSSSDVKDIEKAVAEVTNQDTLSAESFAGALLKLREGNR